MRWNRLGAAIATMLFGGHAWAQEPAPVPAAAPPMEEASPTDAPVASTPSLAAAGPARDEATTGEPRSVPDDPTGGAYTSPTLLFTPAAAVPKWSARVLLSTEVQGPSDVHATFRPGLGAELGLPAGVTLAAGTKWVGGDVDRTTGTRDFSLGISPYVQARLHLVGDANGRGFQLGTSVAYKRVGFGEEPGEVEVALSSQLRAARYELGLQAVVGKELEDGTDVEAHAYALYRVIPELGLGAAGQARVGLESEVGKSNYDVLGGGIASLTIGRYQVGALAGASTLGLAQGTVGAMGQLFGTARF